MKGNKNAAGPRDFLQKAKSLVDSGIDKIKYEMPNARKVRAADTARIDANRSSFIRSERLAQAKDNAIGDAARRFKQ